MIRFGNDNDKLLGVIGAIRFGAVSSIKVVFIVNPYQTMLVSNA